MLTRNVLLVGLGAVLVAAALPAVLGANAPQCPLSPAGIVPALAGVRIPDAVLFSPEGKQVMLPKLLAAKPTVLVVFSGSWCVYCEKELARLQTIEPELIRLGYQIVAISPDSPDALQKGLAGKHVNYQVFSDMARTVSTDLGVLYYVDANSRAWLDMGQWTGNNDSAQPEWQLPDPSIFIVGTNARIQFEHVGASYGQPIDPSELLGAAKCLAEKK